MWSSTVVQGGPSNQSEACFTSTAGEHIVRETHVTTRQWEGWGGGTDTEYHRDCFRGIQCCSSNEYLHTVWDNPDSKVHGANKGPNWGRQDPGGPHVGPMNLAIWELSSTLQHILLWLGYLLTWYIKHTTCTNNAFLERNICIQPPRNKSPRFLIKTTTHTAMAVNVYSTVAEHHQELLVDLNTAL